MADQQAHIHVMTNNPTKYEQISSEELHTQSVTYGIDHYCLSVVEQWGTKNEKKKRKHAVRQMTRI